MFALSAEHLAIIGRLARAAHLMPGGWVRDVPGIVQAANQLARLGLVEHEVRETPRGALIVRRLTDEGRGVARRIDAAPPGAPIVVPRNH